MAVIWLAPKISRFSPKKTNSICFDLIPSNSLSHSLSFSFFLITLRSPQHPDNAPAPCKVWMPNKNKPEHNRTLKLARKQKENT